MVALKSRTIPAADAVAQSLAACRWLKANGARQIFFKYCSTFDSTDAGNIGPVADALLDELGADFTIACPAFPENGRTIYLGHLFVGSDLLSDSSMRNHPLTPMRDANLVRVLGRQTQHKVGLVPYRTVKHGAPAIADAYAALQAQGVRHAIVDAVEDVDLENIGAACLPLPLITGGSGVALGLPANYPHRHGSSRSGRAQRPLQRWAAPASFCPAAARRRPWARWSASRQSIRPWRIDPAGPARRSRRRPSPRLLAWAAARS